MANYFGNSSKIATANAFGIVTVMDVDVYKYDKTKVEAAATPTDFIAQFEDVTPLAHIDHMQVATLSTEGPSIEIQGGKFNNKLIKYGKTARCEMTDALGQADVLVYLGGAEMGADGSISITDKFGESVTMIGHTFVVDQKTGKHLDTTVVLYQFLPDCTQSFAFDSGNAATFDLNGDLLAVELGGAGSGQECGDGTGIFFSLVDNGCIISGQGVSAAAVIYGNGVSGPGSMQLGVEYTVNVPSGLTASAQNLDTGATLTMVGSTITLPTASPVVKRVLIKAGE